MDSKLLIKKSFWLLFKCYKSIINLKFTLIRVKSYERKLK